MTGGGAVAKVAVALLAAGAGRRLGDGRAKPLMELVGRSILARSLDAAIISGLSPVLVVVGHRGDEVAAVVPETVEVVRNEAWATGVASSVAAALERLESRDSVDAVAFGLADQPLVGAEAYLRVAGAYARGAQLAAATYAGARSHPVIVARVLWAEALRIEGDEGARALMREHEVVEVPCDGTGDPTDVDTEEDLAALEARWR